MKDHHNRPIQMVNLATEELYTFTYATNGLRTLRTVGDSKVYQYVYDGSQLKQMTVYSGSTLQATLYFTYDVSGAPVSVTYNGTTYYYVTNLQGDVVAILNSAGNMVVDYFYDAWGNIISSYDITDSYLGTLNPLRYRGYVYDQEIGLYYLQTRYYNPEWGRFISADSYISTGQGILGYNMFAYCGNNPVNRVDPSGQSWLALLGIIAIVALTCTSSQNQTPYKEAAAKAKYNSSNVKVYERDNPPAKKGTINAEIYYPGDSKSNISIDNSLAITSGYEQDAVLDVIIDSPYYSEDIYGSKSFMKAQWIAHNISYNIASSGAVGFWLMQHLSGSDNPIESSNSLDLRSRNNLLKRQKILYTVISWFC